MKCVWKPDAQKVAVVIDSFRGIRRMRLKVGGMWKLEKTNLRKGTHSRHGNVGTTIGKRRCIKEKSDMY